MPDILLTWPSVYQKPRPSILPRRDGNWCHERANMLGQGSYSNADDTIYLLHPVDYVKMYAVQKFYVRDEHVFTLYWFHSAIQSIETLRKCFRTVCEFQPNPDGICIIQFLKTTKLSNTIRWPLTSNVAVIPGSLAKSPLLGYGPGGPVPGPVPESENLCCYGYLHMPPVHSVTLANSQPCLIIFCRLPSCRCTWKNEHDT